MSEGFGFKQKQYEDAQNRDMRESILVAAIVRVDSFDPSANTVDVTPLSKRLQNGKYISNSQILSVPVAPIRGNGLICRIPYEKDDIGVVLYIDHDIDKAWAGEECEPNTERNHSPEDAVFIGGIVPDGETVSGVPDGALVLGTQDGSVYIAISAEGIEIKGDITHEGNTEQEGKTTISEELTVKGIDFTPHKHSDVESGPGTSGPPVGGGG